MYSCGISKAAVMERLSYPTPRWYFYSLLYPWFEVWFYPNRMDCFPSDSVQAETKQGWGRAALVAPEMLENIYS